MLLHIGTEKGAAKLGDHWNWKTSTYKFMGAFYRHERRIATKFGTHVRIETRLALT